MSFSSALETAVPYPPTFEEKEFSCFEAHSPQTLREHPLSLNSNETPDLPLDPITKLFIDSLSDLRPPPRVLSTIEREVSLVEPWSNSWLDRNLKRILFVPTAIGGTVFGFIYSSAFQTLPAAPWWAALLRAGAATMIPHFIPSALGLSLEDPKVEGPFHSAVPITLRWVTRGDNNSHLTRVAVEMAHKLIKECGDHNFRIQIVTDEKVVVKIKDEVGIVRKIKAKSHILMAKERQQIPAYVDVIFVPDSFVSPNGTLKKGRALVYAAFRDKVVLQAYTFRQRALEILSHLDNLEATKLFRIRNELKILLHDAESISEELRKTNSSKKARKLEKIALRILKYLKKRHSNALQNAQYIVDQLDQRQDPWINLETMKTKIECILLNPHSLSSTILAEVKSLYKDFLDINPSEDAIKTNISRLKGFGDFAGLARILMDFPQILRETLEELNSLATSSPRRIASLNLWTEEFNGYNHLLGSFPFTEKSSGVFHLDEESQLTKEVLTGINRFANDRQNAWRLGQGAIQYADTWNRNNHKKVWNTDDIQARFCQLLDSVRRGDDAARFYFQFHGLNQILFGAKGSFLYLPQVLEQLEGYNFDGGEKTSITEDACMAFNVARAQEALLEELKNAIEKAATLSKESDDQFLDLLRDIRFKVSHPLDDATRESLRCDLLDSFRKGTTPSISNLSLAISKVGLKSLSVEVHSSLEEVMDNLSEEMLQALKEAFSPSLPAMEEGSVHEGVLRILKKKQDDFEIVVQTLLHNIDLMCHGKTLGMIKTKDCGWITGNVREQSPFTFWEFIIQRRRWFSGLHALVSEHEHISNSRKNIFRIALAGWSSMQLSTLTFLAPFFTSQYAIHPAMAITLGLMSASYVFLYFWGWVNQIHDSKMHKYGSIALLPSVQLSAANCFESTPGILASVAPDLNFELVEKNRALDDFVQSKDELFSDSYDSLNRDQNYLQLVQLIHKEYLEALRACEDGHENPPLCYEEFLDLLPKDTAFIDATAESVLRDFNNMFRICTHIKSHEKDARLERITKVASAVYNQSEAISSDYVVVEIV
ncbi:MAG: hypothetical protein ACI8RA_001226 [Chlamydiales bacterium]|jgi:hypothetical protein